jgi:UDP-glucose 4-epimerase
MSRCLVTGGAGFIGSHLVDSLVASGHDVAVLDDLSTGRADNLRQVQGRVTVLRESVTNPGAVQEAVRGVDTVYHLAALPSVQRSVEAPALTHEVCATGTVHVLDAARRAGVRRVVYAASSSAYGDTPGAVRSEDDPVAPLSPYATAKLAGEHYCRSFTRVYGLETVRLRFFNVFGPRQRSDSPYSGVIALFIAAMSAGRRPLVYGDGNQSRDFTYVANVVQALQKAAVAPGASGRVYNVGNGATTSLLELIDHLNHLLHSRLTPEFGSARAGDVRLSQAVIDRARKDLGYEPTVSFADGLRLTLEAHHAAGT